MENEAAAGMVALGAFMMVFALLMFAVWIVVGVLYCLMLQKALNRCAPESRTLNPPLVWLLFVPLFNIVWNFVVVLNMAKSLHNEFVKRGMNEDPAPGQTLGLAACILPLLCMIPVVNFLAGPAALVCFILYWIKISGYSEKLK